MEKAPWFSLGCIAVLAVTAATLSGGFSLPSGTVASVLTGIVPIGFLVAAAVERTRSGRLISLSLFFGSTLIVQPEVFNPYLVLSHPYCLAVWEVLRIGMGALGLAIAILAWRVRKPDDGVGFVRLTSGVLIGILHAAFGVLMLTGAMVTRKPPEPRHVMFDDQGMTITIPGDWSEIKVSDAFAAYGSAEATVRLLTTEDHEQVYREIREAQGAGPLQGKTEQGRPFLGFDVSRADHYQATYHVPLVGGPVLIIRVDAQVSERQSVSDLRQLGMRIARSVQSRPVKLTAPHGKVE